jgi:hypothetical protein
MAAVFDRREVMEVKPFPCRRFCEIPIENTLDVIIPELVLATALGTSTCGRSLSVAQEEGHFRTVAPH